MTMTRNEKRNAEFVIKRGAVAPISNPIMIGKLGSRHYTTAQYREHVLGRRTMQNDQLRRDVAIERLRARRSR